MVVLVPGVVWIGSRLSHELPRDVAVRYRLPNVSPGLHEASVVYWRGPLAVAGASFHYGAPAPAFQSHRVRLRPGRYRVAVRLTWADRVEETSHAFRTDVGGGRIDVDLGAGP